MSSSTQSSSAYAATIRAVKELTGGKPCTFAPGFFEEVCRVIRFPEDDSLDMIAVARAIIQHLHAQEKETRLAVHTANSQAAPDSPIKPLLSLMDTWLGGPPRSHGTNKKGAPSASKPAEASKSKYDVSSAFAFFAGKFKATIDGLCGALSRLTVKDPQGTARYRREQRDRYLARPLTTATSKRDWVPVHGFGVPSVKVAAGFTTPAASSTTTTTPPPTIPAAKPSTASSFPTPCYTYSHNASTHNHPIDGDTPMPDAYPQVPPRSPASRPTYTRLNPQAAFHLRTGSPRTGGAGRKRSHDEVDFPCQFHRHGEAETHLCPVVKRVKNARVVDEKAKWDVAVQQWKRFSMRERVRNWMMMPLGMRLFP